MKKKIVYLPLDERPCNYNFPFRLFSCNDFNIVRPEKLGNKKEPADVHEIASFLKQECKEADGLVLSVDMLLYGGLVPSRLHNSEISDLKKLAITIREIREANPKMIIYAFQCIMRCPSYSSNDEEPDYYENSGELIHQAGEALHRSRLGLCKSGQLKAVLKKIDKADLTDYVSRRERNRALNYQMISYVKDGLIDLFVIPQDDSAAYGYAAMDQQDVREQIMKEGLQSKILMYPGADEVGLTLLSRMVNTMTGKKPKVYVKYASEGAKSVLPIYEGSSLENTIRYQILAAGCQRADSYETADIILAVTAPAEKIEEAVNQPSSARGYCVERCLPELIDFISERVKEGKIVSIADNAYGNGGELQLIRMLDRCGLLDKVAGYAGWNTSANTLGTAIAEGVQFYHFGRTQVNHEFLMERYVEDAGYCAQVRWQVNEMLPKYGMNYFNVAEENGTVSNLVRDGLVQFISDYMPSVASQIKLEKVWMPWRRMFEVGLQISCCTGIAGIVKESNDENK